MHLFSFHLRVVLLHKERDQLGRDLGRVAVDRVRDVPRDARAANQIHELLAAVRLELLEHLEPFGQQQRDEREVDCGDGHTGPVLLNQLQGLHTA